MLALKAVTRLISMLLMIAIALVGLGVALYCFDGLVGLGSARPDRLLSLPAVRGDISAFLDRLEAPGPTAAIALLCGIGAIAVGALVLLGILGPVRQRSAVMARGDDGELAIGGRALRSMIRARARRVDGITAVDRPRVTLRRRRPGGRITLTVLTNRTAVPNDVRRSVGAALEPVTAPLGLRTRVRMRPGGPGQRVQ